MTAREVGSLTLADALALTALIAELEPSRFERAAVRWHGRFEFDVMAKAFSVTAATLSRSA